MENFDFSSTICEPAGSCGAILEDLYQQHQKLPESILAIK
jgi:hypothetical protein